MVDARAGLGLGPRPGPLPWGKEGGARRRREPHATAAPPLRWALDRLWAPREGGGRGRGAQGRAAPAVGTHKRRGRPLGRGGVRRSCAQNAQTSGTSEQRRRPRRSLPRSGVSGPRQRPRTPTGPPPSLPSHRHALSPAAPCARRQRTNVGDVRLGGEVSDVHAPRTHKRRGRQSSADVLDVLCPDLVSRAPSGAEDSHRPTSLTALAPPRPSAGRAGHAAGRRRSPARPAFARRPPRPRQPRSR